MGGTLFTTCIPPSPSLSQLPPFSFLSFIPTVSLLSLLPWKDQSRFLLTILSVPLRKYAVKGPDYFVALKLLFLSPDLSVYPARSPFHCCYVFWASPHRLFYHLISSEDEYCWRYFLLFFPAPCCWVLSLLLCPTKRLITVLPLLWKVLFLWINGMTDGERERTEERMSSMPIQS